MNSLMNLELLSSSFLTFDQALSRYLLSKDARYLFNSKMPSNVTSPFSQNKGYSSKTHMDLCYCATDLSFPQVCSQTLCVRMYPSSHPHPLALCLFWKTDNLAHLHFCIQAPARKPYENDRTVRKNDDFTA